MCKYNKLKYTINTIIVFFLKKIIVLILFILFLLRMETQNEFSKNNLQLFFNQIKGEIIEINKDEIYCNITIKVGHSNYRLVNLVSKTVFFENIIKNYKINDIVTAKFYITSNKKNDRYYTTATLLELQKNTL